MNNFRVAAAGAGSDGGRTLDYEYFPAGLRNGARHGEPDDPGAGDDAVDQAMHSKFSLTASR